MIVRIRPMPKLGLKPRGDVEYIDVKHAYPDRGFLKITKESGIVIGINIDAILDYKIIP
jgi:hypothetical protein